MFDDDQLMDMQTGKSPMIPSEPLSILDPSMLTLGQYPQDEQDTFQVNDLLSPLSASPHNASFTTGSVSPFGNSFLS